MEKIRMLASGPAEKLLENRKVFLMTYIDEISSADLILELLYLDAVSTNDIELYINSPGGSISAGLAIYDVMKSLKSDISTICVGQASSMAQILLTAGTKGKRFAYPHAQIMMHQPMGQVSGQVTDIAIQVQEFSKLKVLLAQIIATHTGKSMMDIVKDAERDFYFTSIEAKKYGLIDEVIELRNIPFLTPDIVEKKKIVKRKQRINGKK
jgi:ATP-dependent Clp protease, protease subunit